MKRMDNSPCQRLNSALQARNLNASQLAKKIGRPYNTVFYHTKGDRHISSEYIELYADALGTSPGYFYGTEPLDRIAPEVSVLPFWGEVPAGDWERVNADTNMVQVCGKYENAIVVRAIGRSMEPRIRRGQYIVIQLSKQTRDSTISLVRSSEGLALKVLRFEGGAWQLAPINPDYPVVTVDDWEILGYAVQIFEIDSLGLTV